MNCWSFPICYCQLIVTEDMLCQTSVLVGFGAILWEPNFSAKKSYCIIYNSSGKILLVSGYTDVCIYTEYLKKYSSCAAIHPAAGYYIQWGSCFISSFENESLHFSWQYTALLCFLPPPVRNVLDCFYDILWLLVLEACTLIACTVFSMTFFFLFLFYMNCCCQTHSLNRQQFWGFWNAMTIRCFIYWLATTQIAHTALMVISIWVITELAFLHFITHTKK